MNMLNNQNLETVTQNLQVVDDTVRQDLENALTQAHQAAHYYHQQALFEDLQIQEPVTEEEVQEILQAVQEAKAIRAQETAQNILQGAQSRTLEISGHFVQTGSGPFDWVYVTENGQAYQLTGVDPETGNFTYAAVDDPTPYAQQAANGLPFAQYDDPNENGFDWVIVASNGELYKLEGFDFATQSMVYSPVDAEAQTNGDELVVLPGE
jgi:hypothetical protein